MNSCQITQLNVYPVKSLAGISYDAARVTAKGLMYDRHWMLINPKGQFVTQRQLPKLALITTALSDDYLLLSHTDSGSQISVALQYDPDAPLMQARVWQNECQVLDEGEAISAWLTQVTQSPFPLRLVRMAQGFQREVDQSDKLGVDSAAVITEFADGFPFLIANEASLQLLNQHLEQPIPMNRFRPNIVVAGLDPFAEHKVKLLTNREVTFALQFPCERCLVTTIDQSSAHKHPEQEPLRTLRQLNPMPDRINAAAFGENASLVQGENFIIKVGDSLEVNAAE